MLRIVQVGVNFLSGKTRSKRTGVGVAWLWVNSNMDGVAGVSIAKGVGDPEKRSQAYGCDGLQTPPNKAFEPRWVGRLRIKGCHVSADCYAVKGLLTQEMAFTGDALISMDY